MTLYAPGGDDVVAAASYWHCTYSPHGTGHALIFWQAADATNTPAFGSGIYTDNMALARMLAETLTQFFPEFQAIPVTALPYLPAQCQHTSESPQRYSVTCTTVQTSLLIEWIDPLDCKQICWPQFPAGPHAYDLTTVICPCRQAAITLDGVLLSGEVRTSESNGWPTSSAFLAFAETWVGPVGSS
jgi:hypothetical protein